MRYNLFIGTDPKEGDGTPDLSTQLFSTALIAARSFRTSVYVHDTLSKTLVVVMDEPGQPAAYLGKFNNRLTSVSV